MGLYQKLLWPAFRSMEPEAAHDRIVQMLRLAQSNPLGRSVLHSIAGKLPAQPVKAFGLTFPNVIGVAAGFDKNVRVAPGLGELGFGHVEVGTLTPRPQQGNPRPRVFRLLEDEAVINRMGFPNCGVENALPRLKRMSPATRTWVLGVSLGKQKETPLTEAAQDYVTVMREVYVAADYLAVNISSPNTPDLRDLQHDAYLDSLLGALVAERDALAERHRTKARPLLLKIAPDLTHAELDSILDAALRHGLDGVIATNTTVSRDGARSPLTRETGGLSGKPLAGRSTAIIAHAHRHCGDKLPIIGVGGVLDPADAREKLDAGAVLVQVYTGMVYRGPAIAGNIVRGVAG
jgi:dihydroorotate dehydrogenase